MTADAAVSAGQLGRATVQLVVLDPEAVFAAEDQLSAGQQTTERGRRRPGGVKEPPEQVGGDRIHQEHTVADQLGTVVADLAIVLQHHLVREGAVQWPETRR